MRMHIIRLSAYLRLLLLSVTSLVKAFNVTSRRSRMLTSTGSFGSVLTLGIPRISYRLVDA